MRHLLLLAVMATLLVGAHACAQPAPETHEPGMHSPPPPEPPPMDAPPRGGPRAMGPGQLGQGPMPPGRGGRAEEDLRSLLQQVMMARVSRNLDLSEEQTVVLVRRFSEHQDAMMGLRKKRHGLKRALDEAIEQGADDATIDEKLDALMTLDEEAATAPRQLLKSASRGLSATQRANLYTMLLEFESDLRGMVMRAQQRRGFDGPPQGGRVRGSVTRGKAGEGHGRSIVERPRDIQDDPGGETSGE